LWVDVERDYGPRRARREGESHGSGYKGCVVKERFFRGDDRSRGEYFDPIAEGKRYGLTPEASAAIWARLCFEATNYGLYDEEKVRERFRQAAERVADRGGRLGPTPGKWTQSDVASGNAPVRDVLAEPVPGRTTLVLAHASGRARVASSQVPGRTTLVASQAASDVYTPQDAAGFCRRYVSDGQAARSKLERAIASRDHRAALDAMHALNRDLRLARSHLAHGLAHDEGLQRKLATLEGPAKQLLARLPHTAAGGGSWELWGPDSAEWRAAIDAAAGTSEPATPGEIAAVMAHPPTPRTEPMLPAADVIAGRDNLSGASDLAHTRASATEVHRTAAPLARPRHTARRSLAGTGWSLTPGPAVVPAWATGVAALTNVVQRRAATIFRHEQADADIDLREPVIGEVLNRTRSGEPLPDSVRRDMEVRFGADFRHVRIHTDPVAERAAAALHASAFTLGDDIFFAAGAFAPSQNAGQRLLVHELTHVVQS
jgi:hypothetical protein